MLEISRRSFYKMTHLYLKKFLETLKVYYWLSCGGKGGKVLSVGAELDSHLGNVTDRLKVRSHSSCFQSIFCWHMLETPPEMAFKRSLRETLTHTYSKQWFLRTQM